MANFNTLIFPPFFFIVLLFITIITSPRAIICFSNETDLQSLLAFKSAIDQDPFGALISWNETTHDFCSWNGVQCGGGRRHPDRVISINLSSQGLVGSLSPHIGNLSLLKTIRLYDNTFHGLIPQEIGHLRKLERVGFSNNSFVGPIPQNFSKCSELLYLSMYNNDLSGFIPPELGLLNKLKYLSLEGNQLLSGPIPPSLGNLTSLQKLSLSVCNFSGEIPESFSRLNNLLVLQLAANTLIGNIPVGLFNLSRLYLLALDTNELQGTIPSNIGSTLPNMRFLYLANNSLSGPLPASLSNLSRVEQLALTLNHFTGKLPQLGGLTNLVDFLIGGNNIRDDTSFITSLGNSTGLLRIDASQNLLTGSFPDTVSNLSSLTDLYLDFNQIHGNIPSGIGNLVSLTSIAVDNNHLDGPIPEGVARLSNLHYLSASYNGLTNSLPPSLGNLTSLNILYLGLNNFSGNLPSTLGNCTKLLDFDLSFNSFSGVIPPEIMSLSSVSISFFLSNNHFEGSIPNDIGSMKNLGALDLSNNRLSGRIPYTLAKCVVLQQLNLRGNSLQGEIPSTLSDLKGLQFLDLSQNNLSGPIPSFLGNLKLEYLNLSFNRLNGEVPSVGIFLNETSTSLDGNTRLCGGIPELKLPACPAVKLGHKKNLPTLLKILIPIMGVGGIFFLLAALFIYKKRRPAKNNAPPVIAAGVKFLRLSYADLLKATDGFSENNLLGVGRFGSVYNGTLVHDDGETSVAIKVLNLFIKGASKSFMAECKALRGVRHRNLLKILSICESIDFQGNNFKALVYELKSNGSLEPWLHRSSEEGEENGESNNLTMMQRLSITIDIAQAIKYLHFGTDSMIIHGDLKPSNILLDDDMTACVGDFGLAKIMSDIVSSHESSSSTMIRGTIGYVPPEYGICNAVSAQGDVYSFGIVLLEIFTNKRPTDELFEDHSNLHNFVSASLPDRVMEIVDPLFQTEYEAAGFTSEEMMKCMASILSIGVSCSKQMPNDRMSIVDVVNELSKIHKLFAS